MDSALPSTTTTAPSPASTNQNGKKRKSPSQLALLHKRIRQNLITCPVAISILRDIGLRKRSTLNSGNFLAWAVDPTEPIFQTIHSYVSKGQPGTILHPSQPRRFGIKTLGILRVTPGGIPPQFNDNPENRGQLRMMLWKGCRTIDARKIVKNGLKVWKEKEALYWGSGYYFNDRIDEALDVTFDTRYLKEGDQHEDVFRTGNIANFFLCEVLVGNDMYLTYTKEPDAPKVTPKQSWWSKLTGKLPEEKTVKSIKCEGHWNPDPQGNREIDGCVWPLGDGIYSENGRLAWANQYIVFEETRVIPKYLVKVEVTEGVVEEKIC